MGSIKDRSEKVELKKKLGSHAGGGTLKHVVFLIPPNLGGNDPVWRMDIFQMGWLQLPTRILFL